MRKTDMPSPAQLKFALKVDVSHDDSDSPAPPPSPREEEEAGLSMRSLLGVAVANAEQAKRLSPPTIPPSATPVAGAPVAVSVTAGAASRAQPRAAELLTLEEKAALARSSVIDGRKYYPWVDDQEPPLLLL